MLVVQKFPTIMAGLLSSFHTDSLMSPSEDSHIVNTVSGTMSLCGFTRGANTGKATGSATATDTKTVRL